jgi:intracellular multiplication protein IcmT
MSFSATAHWRDSARVPRFFIVDARAAFPIFFWLLHISWWTGIPALIAILFFAALERYGYTVTVFMRMARTFMAGPRRYNIAWWQE